MVQYTLSISTSVDYMFKSEINVCAVLTFLQPVLLKEEVSLNIDKIFELSTKLLILVSDKYLWINFIAALAIFHPFCTLVVVLSLDSNSMSDVDAVFNMCEYIFSKAQS